MISPFAFENYYEKEEIAIYENLFLKSNEFKESYIKINEHRFNYTITNVIAKDPTRLIIACRKNFHNKDKFNLLNSKIIESCNGKDFFVHPHIINLIIAIHKIWIQSKSFAIIILQLIDKHFSHLDGSTNNYKIVKNNLRDILFKEYPEFLFNNKISSIINIYFDDSYSF